MPEPADPVIHHLDGGTIWPHVMGRFANDAGKMVCHVWAIELADGKLALVDTGVGVAAREDPRGRLGLLLPATSRMDRKPENAVVNQLARLGFGAGDVSDILLTHLDTDHASGLPDFPEARVHVHHVEHEAAMSRPSRMDRARYLGINWKHGPNWAVFGDGVPDGQTLGLDSYELLGGLVHALPLPGHTRGHTGYALQTGEGWLVHAGDAFYHAGSVNPAGGRASRFLQVFERAVAMHRNKLAENHRRLREVAACDDVKAVVCTHDPQQLADLR
jgi:glyoxylase-like metal-dependent hydrolase (beta-lactamase superfamily II)